MGSRNPRPRRDGGLFLLQLQRPLSPSPALSHRLPPQSAEESGAGLGGQQALEMRFLRSCSPSRLREAGAEGEPPRPPPPRSWSPQAWRQGDPEAAVAPGEPLPGDKPSKVSQVGGADGKAQMRGAWLTQPPKLRGKGTGGRQCCPDHTAEAEPAPLPAPRTRASEPCVPASCDSAPETPFFQSLLLLWLNEFEAPFAFILIEVKFTYTEIQKPWMSRK